ncbi:hypothetical protein C8R47DRAFT_1101815 [Mycena vitilis]|nr:hypothetical protein C8R47DRAFT_1101815 [Mycena vitilis]
MPVFALDQILGALLLGTWVASILFGVVLVEAYRYFTLFPDDSWMRKGFVVFVLTVCIAALVGDYATTYYPTVTYWGDVEALGTIFWSLPLSSLANTMLATIVDAYLIYRLHNLTKIIWLTLFLYALLILAIGGYFVVFVLLVTRRNIAEQSTETIGAIINFIAITIVDVSTAGGLIWKLRTMRSSFTQTNTFLNRLMVGAVRTGSITAVCSLLIVATFLHDPDNDISAFFLFQFAPLYTLTLLFNFNLRRPHGQRSGMSNTGSHNAIIDTSVLLSEGVHVHRTAVVTMDPIASVAATSAHRTSDIEEVKHHKHGSSDVESFAADVTTTRN